MPLVPYSISQKQSARKRRALLRTTHSSCAAKQLRSQLEELQNFPVPTQMAPNASPRMTAQDGGLEQQEGGLDRSHDELLALRINITAALKKLAVDEQNRQVIAGGIPLLLQQLSQGGSEPAAQALQVQAAAALGMLATDSSNRRAIADAGGVPSLVQLLSSSIEETLETAAAVVWALAFEQECREAIVAAGGIPGLIHLCASSSSSAVQEHAAGALWNLTYDEPTRAAVAAAGGIHPLVTLLHCNSLEVQQHAAGALANLAVDSSNTMTIAEAAGVTLLVQLLGSSSAQIVEFVIDIVQDCLVTAAAAADAEFSKAVAVAGGLPALVRLLLPPAGSNAAPDAASATIRPSAATCLASLATDPAFAKAIADVDNGVPALIGMTGSCNLEEQEVSATILGLIAAVDDDCRRAICRTNGAAALVVLLDSSSHSVVANAAAAVSNLAAEAECRRALAEAGGIQKLLNLLSLSQAQQQQQLELQGAASSAAACSAVSFAGRPSLSLMSEARVTRPSVADSLVSQPDSWLCPMSSVAPLVNNAAVIADV